MTKDPTPKTPKPPKPFGVARNIRRKAVSDNSFQEAINACSALISQDIQSNDFVEYVKQTSFNENDRAAAIIYAANVENSLDGALRTHFNIGRLGRLFKPGGPLGTFANKIDMGFALDIFGPKYKANFDIIRNIRNVFAHAKRPATFNTAEIDKACRHLELLAKPKMVNLLKNTVPIGWHAKSVYADVQQYVT